MMWMGLRPGYDGFAEMGGGSEGGGQVIIAVPIKLKVRVVSQ